jgi:hypothetical protein
MFCRQVAYLSGNWHITELAPGNMQEPQMGSSSQQQQQQQRHSSSSSSSSSSASASKKLIGLARLLHSTACMEHTAYLKSCKHRQTHMLHVHCFNNSTAATCHVFICLHCLRSCAYRKQHRLQVQHSKLLWSIQHSTAGPRCYVQQPAPARPGGRQCSSARHVHLVLVASLEQVRSFASWLPKHAQLVKSITANVQRQYHWTVLQEETHKDAAVAVLTQALHAAARRVTTQQQPTLLTPAATAAAGGNALPQCGLHLASFTSNLPWLPSVLDALPADTLAQLDIKLVLGKEPAAPAAGSVTAALARLSKLQQLVLHFEAHNITSQLHAWMACQSWSVWKVSTSMATLVELWTVSCLLVHPICWQQNDEDCTYHGRSSQEWLHTAIGMTITLDLASA